MPKGDNLSREHQSAAGRKAIGRPKTPRLGVVRDRVNPDESMEDATLRLQQARADTETLDALKRELELATARGELIPASAARDNLEAEHLRWVAELEQLPHSCVSALPPDIPASMRDVIRAVIDAQCLALRTRIANG